MNNQEEQSRLNEDNIADTNTDVTRSERQQRANTADEGRSTAMSEGQQGDDSEQRSMEQTGSHQEGNYDKTSSKPMVDKEGMGQ